ncbi:MAG: NUDIX domain-containing protein, partial [Ilumatobacteraceae bacterium]
SHEDSIAAAKREAQEEAGIDPSKFLVRDEFSDDHGPWRYDTEIAHAQGEIGAFEANAESDDLQWVALSSVETFELHAGLAGAWPQLHERVRSTL